MSEALAMTRHSESQEQNVMSEINITPFTDVLLVLLIIFMILTALAGPPGFQKKLSRQPAPGLTAGDFLHQIHIEVTKDNRVFIDGHQTGLGALYNAMAAVGRFHTAHRAHSSTHISLLADADASYNTIIKV